VATELGPPVDAMVVLVELASPGRVVALRGDDAGLEWTA
jgi:hypothetical protein